MSFQSFSLLSIHSCRQLEDISVAGDEYTSSCVLFLLPLSLLLSSISPLSVQSWILVQHVSQTRERERERERVKWTTHLVGIPHILQERWLSSLVLKSTSSHLHLCVNPVSWSLNEYGGGCSSSFIYLTGTGFISCDSIGVPPSQSDDVCSNSSFFYLVYALSINSPPLKSSNWSAGWRQRPSSSLEGVFRKGKVKNHISGHKNPNYHQNNNYLHHHHNKSHYYYYYYPPHHKKGVQAWIRKGRLWRRRVCQ